MLALSLPALALGVGCALFYAGADALRKAAPRDIASDTILFYYIAGHIPVLALWALGTGETAVSGAYILPGLVDAALGLAANLLFLIAIRRSPLSLMVPLLALVPVFTLIFGGLTLGEWPAARQDAGILLVAAGLFALFQPSAARPGPRTAWAVLRAEKGSLPMLGVVLLWSATPALDKLCLAHADVGMHGLIQVTLICAALGLWMLRKGPGAFRLPRGARGPVGGSAVAGALGYGFQLAAYAIALVALVEVVRRTAGLLGALALGRAAFREPLSGAKLAGGAIIAVGLPLVMIA